MKRSKQGMHAAPARIERGGSTKRATASGPAGFSMPPHDDVPRPARRALIAAAACVCLTLACAGGVFAWYQASSQLSNLFTRGMLEPAIDEQFAPEAGVKEHVKAANPSDPGNVDSYMRAQVSVYWEDANGVRFGQEPVERASAPADDGQAYDYAMEWGAFGAPGQASSWVRADDGLYYWTSPLQPGASSGDLIVRCTEHPRYDDGRRLVVDIAMQAVQADPADAFAAAWGPSSGLVVGPDGVLADGAAAAPAAEGEAR